MRLGFILQMGTLLLGITTLASSPIYGQPQPNYVAQQPQNPPANGQPGSTRQRQRPPAGGQSRSTYRFDFTSSTEYSNCLEDILLLHANKEQLQQQGRQSNCLAEVFQTNLQRGVSKNQARQMIESANRYATSSLRPKLYPPRGQRERIAALLGFIYEVDKNDRTIRELTVQGPSALDSPADEETELGDHNEETQSDDGGW